MALRLYNTLTRDKEDFVPLDPGQIRMYVCGPTVYDFAHIGNARPVIVFDVLFRLLRHLYGEAHVAYVRNVTDIDDKIIARASERRGDRAILEVVRELTAETGRVYHEDMAALGCLAPTHEPRATEYVPRMIAFIEKLIETGHAYPADGHVLFDVSSKSDYGKLAHRSTDEMIAGARVEVAPYKRGAMDFVLWKPSDDSLPGWPSPWGRGRPGWHIECSAMGEALLGETFDIHGGGIDLVFPHHENEIAQSESAHGGHALARVWMHNGFLNAEGEKMSKSVGNFVTIHEILSDWPGDVVRLNMLRTHYRQPIDWTVQGMKESWNVLERWYDSAEPVASRRIGEPVLRALLDDLNTPQAIVELHRAAPDELAGGLSLLGFSPDPGRIAARPPMPEEEIAHHIAARIAARKARNFGEADRIRDALAGRGVLLMDNPDGTTSWQAKR
ncbi:MAG TPA: cysteine--tRNA ligase [Rhizomicrobium sp.]